MFSRLNYDDRYLNLLNKKLFHSSSCIVTDAYHAGDRSVNFELFSECGKGEGNIPGDQIPSDDVVNAVLQSNEYENYLRNTTIWSFEKKTIFYVLNIAAPRSGDSDNYSIKQIETHNHGGNVKITDIFFSTGGDYTLAEETINTFKMLCKPSLYEVVSMILESIIDETLDMGEWEHPNEEEVMCYANEYPKVQSAKALADYGKKLLVI